jgi:hypothetical protein
MYDAIQIETGCLLSVTGLTIIAITNIFFYPKIFVSRWDSRVTYTPVSVPVALSSIALAVLTNALKDEVLRPFIDLKL